jgi:hypothetical protein
MPIVLDPPGQGRRLVSTRSSRRSLRVAALVIPASRVDTSTRCMPTFDLRRVAPPNGTRLAGLLLHPAIEAATISDAWINFARKGDPNHRGLPPWPAFATDKVPTMCFDKTCEVKTNHNRELRKAVADAS